jgi:hypothetical protein
MGKQTEALKHHPHLVAAQVDEFLLRKREEILAVDQDVARGRFDEARKTPHYSRFSRARQPHDDEDFAAIDLETHVARGWDPSPLPQPLHRLLRAR